MNGYLVIVVFTVILAVTLYWLQGRQSKIDASIEKKKPEKQIEIVKARDWVIDEKKEVTKQIESNLEPVIEKEEAFKEISEPSPDEVNLDPILEEIEIDPNTVEEKDISMLSGVGPKYRSLLKEAGYTTVNQIASSEPQELLDKLLEANERASITKRPPNLTNIEKWIELARTLLA